jgi:hypothetical protein
MTSAVALANNLYSAYVLDLDIVACFLAFHDIRFEPTYTAKLHVDLLSSGHPAQSASANALTMVDEDLLNRSPREIVPRKYHNMRFIVIQCTIVGACRN